MLHNLRDHVVSSMIHSVNELDVETCKFMSSCPPVNFTTKLGDITALRDLVNISLSSSFIVDVGSEVFDGMDRLELVVLQDNKLSRLNDVFGNARNLKGIDVTGNEIRDVDEVAFRELHELEFLRFGKNRLRELRAGTFDDLNELALLDLSSNLLRELPGNVFQSLVKLKVLDLSRNNITALPKGKHKICTSLLMCLNLFQ